jgi:hypothetical protein
VGPLSSTCTSRSRARDRTRVRPLKIAQHGLRRAALDVRETAHDIRERVDKPGVLSVHRDLQLPQRVFWMAKEPDSIT